MFTQKLCIVLLAIGSASASAPELEPAEQLCTAKLFPGNGSTAPKIKNVPAQNISDCCAICVAEPECGHFVFTSPGNGYGYQKGTCHLKKGGAELIRRIELN